MLLAVKFAQHFDLRTAVEQVRDAPSHFLHVFGLAMVVERSLVGVSLVPDELGGIIIGLVQDVGLAAWLCGANLFDHVAEGFLKLTLAALLGFDPGDKSN